MVDWSETVDLLRARLPERTVERGHDYFERGRVQLLEREERYVHAAVLGTRRYTVEIEVSAVHGGLESHCTCPAARRGPCKHEFATLLALEAVAREDAARSPAWSEQLERVRRWDPPLRRDPWARVPGVADRLVFVLCRRMSRMENVPVLRVMGRTRRKNGGWSAPRDLDVAPHARFREEDERLLGVVFDDSHEMPRFEHASLSRANARDVLVELARAGVLHLGEQYGPPHPQPLAWDGDGPYAFRIRVDRDGVVRVSGEFVRGETRLPLDDVETMLECGVLAHDGALAEVDFDGAAGWAWRLRETGPLVAKAEEWPALAHQLLAFGEPLPLAAPLPAAAPPAVPTGVLRLDRDHRFNGPVAHVSFRYGNATVAAEAPANVVVEAADGVRHTRDLDAESGLLARLRDAGARPGPRGGNPTAVLPTGRARAVAAALHRDGWEVEDRGHAWRTPDAVSFRVASGIDWFDLAGGVQFGAETVELPAILAAARRGDGVVPLADGAHGLLPDGLAERLALLDGLGRDEDGALRFGKNQGWILDALLAEQDAACEADAGFAELRKRAARFERIRPRRASRDFDGELRPYQRDALGWLRFLETMGLGGCLADDMGLGKTVMVLAHLLHHRRGAKAAARKPALVVAPKSLVWNWLREAERFAPSLSVLDYSGPAATRDPRALAAHDLAVTTYGVLRRDAGELRDVPLSYAILDEAQAVKNPASQTWKAARLLQADHRLALTGTPVENHLGDLWAILDFLNPGMCGPRKTHGAWAKAGEALRETVARLVKPVVLRRTKEEVLQDLPPRQETLLHCEMGPAQRRSYDELRDHFRAALLGRIADEGLSRSRMHVLEALLRLRQCACHPALLDAARAGRPSAKFDALVPRLQEVRAAGRKALVFSQFTSLLALLRERLDADGTRYAYLDGATKQRDRVVQEFADDPDVPLFLISLKAGGVGLNLTAADHVFLLDPWWNPAVERQAVDRTHRIGQTRTVNVYRLVAADTVEERILELQQRKRDLADAVVGADAKMLRGLTREDVEALLGA